MNTPTLAQDVARGVEIVRLMKLLKEELDEIAERIEARALKGPHVALEDAEREGRQFIARAVDVAVPVVMTADSLMQSFVDGSASHVKIAALAGDQIDRFYRLTKKWETRFKDGKEFRAKALELLGENGAAFVAECLSRDKNGIPKSKVEIAWNRAMEMEVAA